MSPDGNCKPQDSTEVEVLNQATSTYQSPCEFEEIDFLDPFLEEEEWITPEPPAPSSPEHSHLISNACVYIAGWVIRKVVRKVKCDPCRQVLVDQTTPIMQRTDFLLLRLKQRGGLVVPSSDSVVVVISADKHFRRLCPETSPPRGLLQQLQYRVLKDIGSRVFNNDHTLDTSVSVDNHSFTLIKTMVEVFFHLRVHHLTKTFNLHQKGKSMRHNANKTVLFKGQ